jgi:hypothetical protein
MLRTTSAKHLQPLICNERSLKRLPNASKRAPKEGSIARLHAVWIMLCQIVPPVSASFTLEPYHPLRHHHSWETAATTIKTSMELH